MNYFCRYLCLRLKDCREIRQINPSQTLMDLQYDVEHLEVRPQGRDLHVGVSLRCT